MALVFENDAKVKVRLIKLDDSDNPLPGAVFNIIKDGQIIGTEATKADGSITVTDVTEGMYAFVEVSAPAPYATLTEPVIAHKMSVSTILTYFCKKPKCLDDLLEEQHRRPVRVQVERIIQLTYE